MSGCCGKNLRDEGPDGQMKVYSNFPNDLIKIINDVA